MKNDKLLQPGWAGDLCPEELAFIKVALKQDRRLRAKWGMGRGHGWVNDDKIRAVAMDGIEALNSPSPDASTSLLHARAERDGGPT